MKSKSKCWSFFAPTGQRQIFEDVFRRRDEIPPASLVQSRKRCLVGRAKPQMVSKIQGERERDDGGAEVSRDVNVGLMNYTKEPRWRITYSNSETGVRGGAVMEKFVRTSKNCCCFSVQCLGIAVKLIVKNWRNTDVVFFFFFQVRERGFVRVLLLIMIVLFSSVQCLYSRRLQDGSRVKQWRVFLWWWWWRCWGEGEL